MFWINICFECYHSESRLDHNLVTDPFALMLYYDWRLALVMLVFMSIYLATAYSLEKSVLKHAGSIQEARGKLASVNFQLLNMMAKIRTTGAERGAFAHWAKRYTRYSQVNYNLNRLFNVLAALRTVFDKFGLCLLLIVIGLQGQVLFSFYQQPTELSTLATPPLQNIMPTAHFISFNIAYGMFSAAIFGLVNIAIQLLAVKPLARRLSPILETPPERTQGLIVPEHLSGHILINQLNFRYSQHMPWVLSGVSLEIKPGEFVAIVGASGSGKSTLLRLLLNFEQPIAGSIYIDKQALNTLNMLETRRHMGVVLQQSALLAGSIYNNVSAGIALTEEQVWAALAIAQLDNEIRQMPMQLETMVNEGATTLSGGQKQRLMIARAIAKNPNILIFDEATSALDNVTQLKISQALAIQQCTRLVIAHRHSTIMHADKIYVMVNGRIVEQGSYHELLEKKEYFYDLVHKQII